MNGEPCKKMRRTEGRSSSFGPDTPPGASKVEKYFHFPAFIESPILFLREEGALPEWMWIATSINVNSAPSDLSAFIRGLTLAILIDDRYRRHKPRTYRQSSSQRAVVHYAFSLPLASPRG
jgi:hypothetical protein